MKLLRLTSSGPAPEDIYTERLLLRRPKPSDFEQWARLRQKSAGFLRPFEPSWTSDELSRSSFKARLRRQEADINSGRGLPWFVIENNSKQTLLGGLTLSNIRRGVAQTATLGYWMGEPFAGHGYMSEAVMAVCASAFEVHRLHRVEASTVLHNTRSQGLLEKCKFEREGIAKSYLKIDGQWEDHILFARVNNSS